MRGLLKIGFVLVAAVLLASCATQYQRQGPTGGYTDTQIAPDVFRVTIRGNAFLSDEQAHRFAMRRAAEITIQRGFTYLTIIESSSGSVSSVAQLGRDFRGNPSYTTVHKPRVYVTFRVHDEEHPGALDAKETLAFAVRSR